MEDQQLAEVKLLGGALQELAVRNLNLEERISALKEKETSAKMKTLRLKSTYISNKIEMKV